MKHAYLALVACATPVMPIEPIEIHRASAQLKADRHATVPGPDGAPYELKPGQDVDIVDLRGNHARMQLSDLVRSCDPAAPYEGHTLCGRADVDAVLVAPAHSHPNLVRNLFVGGAVVGMGVCAFECGSPYNYVSVGGLVVTAGLAAVAGFLYYVHAMNHD